MRRESLVWKFFIKYNVGGKTKGKCKYCNTEYTTNAKRMANHLLLYCKSCPSSVKEELKETKKFTSTKRMV